MKGSTSKPMLKAEYNIIGEAAKALPAIQEAIGALRPEYLHSEYTLASSLDIMDWLKQRFGFQEDNVLNQREHVILLLANHEPPHSGVHHSITFLHNKLLENYRKWCSFLGETRQDDKIDYKFVYPCLYLLIWGEASNLRFMPECLCYMFHHMARRVNDEIIREAVLPNEPKIFLEDVITPIYKAVAHESEGSKKGTAPHSSWRNYDDMNEFFWSDRCFSQLGWPVKPNSDYLENVPIESESNPTFQRLPSRRRDKEQRKRKMKHAKTMGFKVGFVEQRSFWNIFHSFHRLWIAQILLLQILITFAFLGDREWPWRSVLNRDNQIKLLYTFVTWAALLTLQAFLTIGLQFTLISRNTKLLALRMALKLLTSMGWTAVFSIMIARIEEQRARDPAGSPWSQRSNLALFQFLKAVCVFLLPEIVASLLFFMPPIANFIENCDWKPIRVLSWWFYTRTFVGRGLHQDLVLTLKYTLFWIMILAAKVSFSYTIQIQQLVEPTHNLLGLKNVQYEWYVFFGTGNMFEVFLLWVPVLLIYLMDIQIWYSIFSSLMGVTVGLFSHIGEIRNMQQLQLRFPFFASAVTFNVMAEEYKSRSISRRHTSKLQDMMTRLRIRHGSNRNYMRLQNSDQADFQQFALLWNRVIDLFRKEDLLSKMETWLLMIPPQYDDVRTTQWPLVLLSNKIANALSIAIAWKDDDTKKLWKKIGRDNYRKSAVIEAFCTLKYILLGLCDGTCEQVKNLIKQDFDDKDFLHKFDVKKLKLVNSHVVILLKLLLLHENKPSTELIAKIYIAYVNVIDVLVRDLRKPKKDLSPGSPDRQFDDLLRDLNQLNLNLSIVKEQEFQQRVKRMHFMITREENMASIPRNLEARRRLAFFGNSLFMNLPKARPVERMIAFSVLIPHYDEDVIYQISQLDNINEDGISIMYYLQKVFPDEWENFQERHKEEVERRKKGDQESRKDDLKRCEEEEEEVVKNQLWASFRGQTLARTVRGMMYYEKALELLAHLEKKPSPGLSTGCWQKPRIRSDEKEAPLLKFSLVVASQIYGELRHSGDVKADNIFYLMKKYPAMRVAYVDEKMVAEEKKYYSVLVKCEKVKVKCETTGKEMMRKQEVEVYRILLPGPFLLGEGKPENQNQAIIYTRGEALQAIDMNQDNYFEEALKMRNLLQELEHPRRPRILGIREHVFTGSVSSLAFFMSAQETSFVTLGQRVLANPLRVRMHYGHPDVFDRLWFLTRGGISKASRAINISEDIFAGINCTLRGGSVTHHEYIQVGKGRDLGLNQIATFEAKVSGGNGEQTLSRDVYRMGHCLDFVRMTSFYYTSIGFYFNNLLIVLAAYAYMWSRVYLGLSGIENRLATNDLANAALIASLDQQFVLQIGVLTSIPLILENSLEHGFTEAIWRFLLMQLQLCSVFYTFSMGTKGHFYGRTLLHGGARYKGTGRGFVVKRESFVTNYCLYSRSHFVKGIELIILLVIYDTYSTIVKRDVGYLLTTFSFWFLAMSWNLGPFLFNPSGFEWLRMVEDYDHFMAWLWQRKGASRKAEESWEVWWNNAQEHLNTTGLWGRVVEVVLSARFFLIQYGMVYRLKMASHNKSILVYLVSWTYVVAAIVVYIVVARAADKYSAKKHMYYRCIQVVVVLFVAMVIGVLVLLTDFGFSDFFVSMLAFLPTGWGLLCMAAVLKPYVEDMLVWTVVVDVARLYDLAMALIVMAPVALLSWLPAFQSMQTRLLFNLAFSRGLQISKLLTGKKSILVSTAA